MLYITHIRISSCMTYSIICVDCEKVLDKCSYVLDVHLSVGMLCSSKSD